MQPYALTCELRSEPLGIDEPRPRLRWRLTSPRRGDRPTAFRLTVARTAPDLEDAQRRLWDSGWREGEAPLGVVYDGPPLESSTRYHWAVEVRDVAGEVAGRDTSWFETALLHGEWQARWIGHDPLTEGPMPPPQDHDRSERTRHLGPARHLRREVDLGKRPVRARAYVSARGVYRFFVNGHRVGDHELAPGWTEYHQRIPYQTYDITDLLVSGSNAFGAVLADGWWSGYVGFDSRRAAQHYGDAPQFIAQIVLDGADGSRRVLVTDGDWREADGPIRYTDHLMGELVDARVTLPGWDTAGFDDASWAPVLVAADDHEVLEAQVDEPVRAVATVAPVALERKAADRFIVDLGQNLVGRVRLRVRSAKAGDRIVMRFGEMLDDDGEVYVENLKTAEATDTYLAAGHAEEVFEPWFTTHGFRYVEVVGYPGELAAEDLEAVVLQSDTPWTGEIETSDQLVNQLISNLRWGQRGNFVAVPTDCPQRDERLGWMADAQIFLPTAMRNADVAAFFSRWMRDVRGAQDEGGAFPDVVPRMCMPGPGAPAWGDAGVIIPWLLHREYGDVRVLADSFDAMARWIDHVHAHNPDLIWRHHTNRSYGDWLHVGAETSRDLLSTAYFARSTWMVADAAATLGRRDEAARYADLAADIRAAFVRAFWKGDRLTDETQTAYLLALGFELLDEADRPAAAERLVAMVEAADRHLTTGFIGVALLCPVLCDIGRPDLAYAILHQDGYPSWNYSIHQGATTIWERWDAWTIEHGFQSAAMNSFNHYSLGSVGEWLYGYVAGLRQEAGSVAWQRVAIEPVVGGRLRHAAARQHTVRGVISSSWHLVEGDALHLRVSLPPGVSGTVTLPAASREDVEESGQPLGADLSTTSEGGRLRITVPSGTFSFVVRGPA
ncbi:Bacterial alpha-L-rhamnosidase [Nitriliruptoraceae bacterium ZYF776]|nr:Bacterial alpha-L-rhamnosidase [Profundirhabdus halotolerans]